MVTLRLHLEGDALQCLMEGTAAPVARKALDAATLVRLRGWARDYDAAVRADQPDALIVLGRDIAAWLDDGDAVFREMLSVSGAIGLEIQVPAKPCALGQAVLDVPWELLAEEKDGYLAADPDRLFTVARRLGPAGEPLAPRHQDIALMFMTAEPEGGGSILDYEREESAILTATRSSTARDKLHLMVEESGSIDFLRDRLAQEPTPVEVVHLSCHGTIIDDEPMVALETPEGRVDRVSVQRLHEALGNGDGPPPLVVLSACRTAEQPGGAAASFVQRLVRGGIANALGWDGSVYDGDATHFAEAFYGALALGRTVPAAAALARRALLAAHANNPDRGRHWHLARVLLGPAGGGALSTPRGTQRVLARQAGTRDFLDRDKQRVPVAGPTTFVGRRRPAQRILRAFNEGEGAGVLLQGMGSLGKSSLAARIAHRLPHHRAVVLYERYDPQTVLSALERALPEDEQEAFQEKWQPGVQKDPRRLKRAVQSALDGPLSGRAPGTPPILLIIDDLEQRLEQPRPGQTATPFKTEADTITFAALIAAFRDARTDSRLLITSRYRFALKDRDGDDLTARLVAVPLPPMRPDEQIKQMRAAGVPGDVTGDPALSDLRRRIRAAAAGNPGLQDILTRPMLANQIEAAERAVAAVEGYLATGKVPTDDNAALEFFRRVTLDTYRAMLTPDEAAQLQAATLFQRPVPRPILAAAGRAAGVAAPDPAVDRLLGLGLLDRYPAAGGEEPPAAVNPLARPLVPSLTDADQSHLARAIIDPLCAAWTEDDGKLPFDRRAVEAARLALLGPAPAATLNRTARRAVGFLWNGENDARAALPLARDAVAAILAQDAQPDVNLLGMGADCAARLGAVADQERFLAVARDCPVNTLGERARVLVAQADRLMTTGPLGPAEAALREAELLFVAAGEERNRAVTLGRIADILADRGERERDEALRIRREEQLPVFERLGDVRERAVTLSQIADILEARGELGEALSILRNEVLPVFERLGAVRERAVTLGRIAQGLEQEGKLGDALRIYLKECLPVAKAAYDMAGFANIRYLCARIRLRRGGWGGGEEETIFQELAESFVLAMKLGRADFIATMGHLFARILVAVDRTDAALAVLDHAAAAAAKLGWTENLANIRALQAEIHDQAVAGAAP